MSIHHPAHYPDNRRPRRGQLPMPILIVRKDHDHQGGGHERITAPLKVKHFLLGEGGRVRVRGEGADEGLVDGDVLVGGENEAGGNGYDQDGENVQEIIDNVDEEWAAPEEPSHKCGHGRCGLGC